MVSEDGEVNVLWCLFSSVLLFRYPDFPGLFSPFPAVSQKVLFFTLLLEKAFSPDTLSFLFFLPRCTFKIPSFFGEAGKGGSRVPESQGNSGECLLLDTSCHGVGTGSSRPVRLLGVYLGPAPVLSE